MNSNTILNFFYVFIGQIIQCHFCLKIALEEKTTYRLWKISLKHMGAGKKNLSWLY
jgi:hypothetical protein